MSDRYRIEFEKGGVGALETILTGGLAKVVEKGLDAISGDDNHGWNCTITDNETGIKETRWGATKAEAQEKTFYALKREIEHYVAEQQNEKAEYQQRIQLQKEKEAADYQRQLRQQQQSSSQTSSTEDDGASWIGKIIGYCLIGMAIIWFVFSVAIPLIFINLATIALIAGIAEKKWSKYLFPVSILGTIILVFDFNNGWSTKTLVNNVSFFAGFIPVFFYTNIVAGLVAAYFLIRNYLNEKKPPVGNEGEFSKRNLIIMGCLFVVGGSTVGLQKYFDSQNPQKVGLDINHRTNPVLSNSETEDWEGGDGSIENAVGQNEAFSKQQPTKEDTTQLESNETPEEMTSYGALKKDRFGNKYAGRYDSYGKRQGDGILITTNGSRYEGEFKNDLLFKGVVDLLDDSGNRYKGEYSNNQRVGSGLLITSNGSKYEGEFKNNLLFKGSVDLTDSDKSHYIGEYSNNKRVGKGTLITSNGSKYEGIFQGGKFYSGDASETDDYGSKYTGQYGNFRRNGKGTLITSNDSEYEGTFQGGKFHSGNANETDDYGSKYTGQYDNFRRDGNGTLITSSGSKYEGTFQGGKFHSGNANETDDYGSKYTGQYDNFRRNGNGTLITSSGSKYEGTFQGGKFHSGNANETDDYGSKYTGQYDNFRRNGNGTLVTSNGSKYEGTFQNGKFWSGYANETDDYGNKFSGYYKNGRPVK